MSFPRGKVHHGVGPEVNRHMQLLQFFVDIAGNCRVADIGVDLAFGCDADAHRFEPSSHVYLVGRDDHAADRHLFTDEFRFESLPLRDEFHFRSDISGPGFQNLSHIAPTTSPCRSAPKRLNPATNERTTHSRSLPKYGKGPQNLQLEQSRKHSLDF